MIASSLSYLYQCPRSCSSSVLPLTRTQCHNGTFCCSSTRFRRRSERERKRQVDLRRAAPVGRRTTFRHDHSTTRPSRRRDREAHLTISALRRTTRRNVARSLLFRSSLLLSLSIDARTSSKCGKAERSCACPEPRAPGAEVRAHLLSLSLSLSRADDDGGARCSGTKGTLHHERESQREREGHAR